MIDTEIPPTGSQNFQITTPGDWIAVDIERVAGFDPADSNLPAELLPAVQYLKSTARVFEASGVVYGAFLVERGSREALATISSLLVKGPPREAGALAELVRNNPPNDVVEGSFQVSTASNQNEEAVRSESLRRSILEAATRDAVSFTVEYFIRVPGRTDLVLTAFSTPNARAADSYRELFDTIAATIVLT